MELMGKREKPPAAPKAERATGEEGTRCRMVGKRWGEEGGKTKRSAQTVYRGRRVCMCGGGLKTRVERGYKGGAGEPRRGRGRRGRHAPEGTKKRNGSGEGGGRGPKG